MMDTERDRVRDDKLFASIIVPVFNSEATVRRTVQSAQAQTRHDIEIILVDDGSIDASPEIIRDLAKQDPRIVGLSQSNQGQGAARNYGLSVARGNYVLFLDSDDVIEPDLCAAVADAFTDDIDVVAFGLRFCDSKKRTVVSRTFPSGHTLRQPELTTDGMLDRRFLTSPCCKAYRREFLHASAIAFPTVRAFEDVLFSRLVATQARGAKLIPGLFYHALVREGSTSRSLGIERFETAKELIGLERQALGNKVSDSLLGAHILRFLSHLLILAAFRVSTSKEREACHRIADEAGFARYARDPEALAHLSPAKRVQVGLAARPWLLHPAARIARRLGYLPY